MTLLLFAALFTTQPDATELVQKAIAARKAQEDRVWKFTWREDYEQIDKDKNGKVFGRKVYTSDVIMLEGSNYTKLVLIDGKPLDEKTQNRVDKELEQMR